MARSKNVDSWMSELDPSLRTIGEAIRGILLETEPGLRESVKWSNPVYERKGRVCYISATQEYVTLGFFNGAELSDPEGRIEGTGKAMRHHKVKALEDLRVEQVTGWVREAVAVDERDPR